MWRMDTATLAPVISKAEAIAAYDGNASALARALGVTPQAIYQWPDGPVAEGYALKLFYVLKPKYFADRAVDNDDDPDADRVGPAVETA